LAKAIPAEPVVTTAEHIAKYGRRWRRARRTELTEIARRELGSGIDLSFPRFVEWLRSEGYMFGGFDDGPLRFGERRAYLRYDVHRRDLFASYILADLHERLALKGSFQILWMFATAVEPLKPYFLKLLEFDRRFVQFGLHAAPMASWFSWEKLGGGDHVKHAAAVDSEDFTAWLLDLYEAYGRDGERAAGLREIREGTDDTLSTIATSFRAEFGEWTSISAHGNFFTNGFLNVCARYPEVAVLRPYFHPVDYFAKWGVSRFGFGYEVTALGDDEIPFPRVLYEGNSEEIRRTWYRGRVAHGAGFVALLHPATWTCRVNATFFLPEGEALVAFDQVVGEPYDIGT
jgi:hypothetical protein